MVGKNKNSGKFQQTQSGKILQTQSGKIKRVQSGNLHVCFRGNSRNVVFYDDNDIIQLLLRINRFAKQYNTKIIAFVIMQNHAHLQVITNNVTQFMRSILNSYSRWYNMKYGMSNQVFKSPFMSTNKRSREWALNSVLYILNNPIKAGLCSKPKDYRWSSYHFYFERRNSLIKYIEIDTTFVEGNFKNREDLDSSIIAEVSTELDIHERSLYSKELVPYSEIIKYMNQLLKGAKLPELSREQTENLIVALKEKFDASYRQIASIMHESWEFVRRTCEYRGTISGI